MLSGGGAKGVAHIKALKVIEEAGIPIDYIVGTSMGSIVGGLYAIGYTPEQLDSMVRKQNWTFLLSDRIKRSSMSLTDRERSEKHIVSIPFTKNPKEIAGGLIKGQNLANLFSDLTVGYHDSISFNKLPIPLPVCRQTLLMVTRLCSMKECFQPLCVQVWPFLGCLLRYEWTVWYL